MSLAFCWVYDMKLRLFFADIVVLPRWIFRREEQGAYVLGTDLCGWSLLRFERYCFEVECLDLHHNIQSAIFVRRRRTEHFLFKKLEDGPAAFSSWRPKDSFISFDLRQTSGHVFCDERKKEREEEKGQERLLYLTAKVATGGACHRRFAVLHVWF
ncbi:hypothetical protein GMOD_00010290 [Pyrenophora seminiperda CCB06]|uniref:Uncharacterized protein n=1 Tax=Pyrenophora seminiperda CCB06 TaxID=1302712 RepID=A0A3M7M5Q8_9PLEO|nr:hypothetical protein GMOD_00010290 [Pyrenophora seminiperda CCB06]